MSRQRPKRIRPQLLAIPNHGAIVAAFKRALTAPIGLIALELERVHHLEGEGVELVAFTSEPRLTIRHGMGTEDPDHKRLVGAAEVLAQTASASARRYIATKNAREMQDGRQRSAG